ncbi:MAG TPA: EipA family protein [Caulobacterales bacterium]|nr:EipA family protein [Caulobacterales bacterium]
MLTRRTALVGAAAFAATPALAEEKRDDTYSQDELVPSISRFFGVTAAAAGKAVAKVFQENGRPNGYIRGSEGSGAVGVGLRYGKGTLSTKYMGARTVYWQGPSIGFDAGGNASKSFTLVYGLRSADEIYERFPGVDGSYYFIAGIGVNYQRNGHITLAPMRAGVGLRAGANIGYLAYTRKRHVLPL